MNRRERVQLVLIVLVALNLRPAITAVGPLLTGIRADLHLSGAAAGALTTLPLAFFGVFGLVAPLLRRRPGGEALLVLSMALLTCGLLIRLVPVTAALFAGSLVAGIAISIGNIAVPAVIKRDHPRRITAVTALYSTAITVGAATASAVVVPLRDALHAGWRLPLALAAVPAALAGLAWLPSVRRAVPTTGPAPRAAAVWRSRLAWQVTLFMGVQSLLAYVVFAWLPTICQDRGMAAASAGYVLALSSVVQAAGALSVPVIERRLADQRPLVAATALLSVIGFGGFAWAPIGTVWVWTVLLGLGQGIGFATALSFLGLRSPDAATAGQLSGMAQGLGYAIAACGPLAMGALRDATGGWEVPLAVALVLAAALAVPGLAAGRVGTIARPATGPEPAVPRR